MEKSSITLREIEVFLAVVDAGSLSAASQRLSQPVSTTSRFLARLEEKLQTTLLRRTTRRLDLTDEGCSFLKDARGIINSIESAQERVLLRQGQPSGPLRVDAATPFVLHTLIPLLADYRKHYPLVDLTLTSNEDFVDLLESRVDLALRIGEMKDSSLNSRLICRSRIRMLASPQYLLEHGTPSSAADLRQHTLLGFTRDSINSWPLHNEDGETLYIEPDIAASSGEVLRQLSLSGHGIVCLADFMTVQDLASGNLVEVLAQQNTGDTRPIQAVYYRQTALAARVSSFIDHLTQAIRKQAWAIT
ncbi:LysR substrate-binding domain-containing protein [Advenella mimigardefordensis]|uniref:Transcriptional regulator, LysR family n=1 Tax=Advenella mimigardefordensis (strain DSM 17166 / LMG 22922 / DPN7) TaxID=1247726 RepID=W0PAY6_ADVMD|nr:LysR substrate-binding domain-containing protein [Advenella mimigardefordensis]AHG62193.1 transcriptional regulator, LysR family [Advenella mimigardefordensis DPN7]